MGMVSVSKDEAFDKAKGPGTGGPVEDVKERQDIVQGRANKMDEEQGGGIRFAQSQVRACSGKLVEVEKAYQRIWQRLRRSLADSINF